MLHAYILKCKIKFVPLLLDNNFYKTCIKYESYNKIYALLFAGMFARFLGPGMLQGYFLPQKMFSLQFVLIFSKLQGLGVRLATWAGAFPCHPYLPPPVFASRKFNIEYFR